MICYCVWVLSFVLNVTIVCKVQGNEMLNNHPIYLQGGKLINTCSNSSAGFPSFQVQSDSDYRFPHYFSESSYYV